MNGNIANAFSGGINNLDFQFADIDADEDYDLFFLDTDGTYGWYINSGTALTPFYELSFDSIPGMHFSDWFFFVDIDNDGDFDLFTGTSSSFVQFRRNTGTPGSPSFITETDTVLDTNGDPVFSETGSNPAFADVDNDGDFDFITGNSIGTLYFFENTGTPSIFNFQFVTSQWQGLLIVSGDQAVNNETKTRSKENEVRGRKAEVRGRKTEIRNKRSGSRDVSSNNNHGSSSIEFADIDSDGDLDLFWGDYFSRSLYYIENKGTPESPGMELITNRYPQNSDSIYTSGFNMPRLIDIDSDNDLDLFITVLYSPVVKQSMIFFRNEGSVTQPGFIKVTENYLSNIDTGIQSVPAFADIDGDNDLDLFIGSSGSPSGSLYFFENTGSTVSPAFMLIDSVYSGIQGELSIAPSLGDINGDGLYDLLIGNFSGTISLYMNIGSLEEPLFILQDNLRSSSGDVIDIGTFARPFLIDIDSDNDLDLISGSFNGRFLFYRNTGDTLNYSFTEDTAYFGLLDAGENSFPFLTDYDNDGDFDLFSGTRSGNILFFRNDGNNTIPVWNLVTSKFTGNNFGQDAVPYFIDIDSDSNIDLFVGNLKGGLYFYRGNNTTGTDPEEQIPAGFYLSQNYPNPFNPSTKIYYTLKSESHIKITIYNLLGEKITELINNVQRAGFYEITFNGKDLSSGVYFYILEASNDSDMFRQVRKMQLVK